MSAAAELDDGFSVPRCRLYLITPPQFDPDAFAPLLAEALNAGDIAAVQLRLKEVEEAEWHRAIETLQPLVQERGIAFLINDRPDLAKRYHSDGVHIGQEDAAYAEARRAVGLDGSVGVSCLASRHLAMEAAEAGADYVAFGPVFPTATKPDAGEDFAPVDLYRWWSDIATVPSVAIGGITPQNCGGLVRAGVDFLAVISAVWDHPVGPAAAIAAFERAIDTASATAGTA